MYRSKIIILLICIVFANGIMGQAIYNPIADGKYYIVRHAEKDTGRNSVLTAEGYERAGDLFRELKKDKINKIFVSQYLRSQLTADSLRIYKKIDTVHYTADTTGDDLVKKCTILQKQISSKNNVLIIAHSNTIPAILKRLGITSLDINEIPDNEYDNLFIVTVKSKKVSLQWLKFGKASLPKYGTGQMKSLQ